MKKITFPWHDTTWEHFSALMAKEQLPHALLLTGMPGIGKRALAMAMAQSVLCEHRPPHARACGACPSCHWFAMGHHPDLCIVRPALLAAQEGVQLEEDSETSVTTADIGTKDKKLSKEITIQQIRELTHFFDITASRGNTRIAVIYPADAMNSSAANALLKTLEEPNGQRHFFLVSDAPHRLLPTVRSRCRTWKIQPPDVVMAVQWLNEQQVEQAEQKLAALGGSPLSVLELEQSAYWKTQDLVLSALSEPSQLDALALAKQLDTLIRHNDKERQTGAVRTVDLAFILGWLQRWTSDVLHAHFGVPIRYYPQRSEAIVRSARFQASAPWLAYAKWLYQAGREAHHPLNSALFLEDCLLRYLALHQEN